ncbi:MAG: hypothetical protein IKG40_04165 [Bacilli bacterium]|nr:hypothetical protein [Bacilli bacterium]
MREREKRRKNILIGALLAVVVLMGIAYAAFVSNLTITGTGTTSGNWCIGFDSRNTSAYTATAGVTGGTTPTGSMSFSGDSCSTSFKTTASLNASFKQPGDKIEYTLTIGNKGTLAAAIESINVDNQSVTSDTTITKGNIKYIIEMPEETSLAVNATTTMKVTAMFQNDTEVESSTNEQQTISVSINAVQDDGNGGFTPDSSPGDGAMTIYRHNTNVLFNGLAYNGEATVWYSSNSYSSAAEAYANDSAYSSQASCEDFEGAGNCVSGTATLSAGSYVTDASELNKAYYLKHTIVNNIVTETYVCFVYNNAEHCMKGGDNGASFAANTQVIQDYQTFYNLPNDSNPGCSFNSNDSHCYGGGIGYMETTSYGGYVLVGEDSMVSCVIHLYNDGSYCSTSS